MAELIGKILLWPSMQNVISDTLKNKKQNKQKRVNVIHQMIKNYISTIIPYKIVDWKRKCADHEVLEEARRVF